MGVVWLVGRGPGSLEGVFSVMVRKEGGKVSKRGDKRGRGGEREEREKVR
jgi:hypothetical protein